MCLSLVSVYTSSCVPGLGSVPPVVCLVSPFVGVRLLPVSPPTTPRDRGRRGGVPDLLSGTQTVDLSDYLSF